MSPRAEKIRNILMQAFKPTLLHVEDESWKHAGHAGAKESGGGHFVIHITAEKFSGQSRINCHRMIHQALASEFKQNIHALSIHYKAP